MSFIKVLPLHFVLVFCFILLTCCKLSTQRIEQCMQTANIAKPKSPSSKSGRQLFLYFGDAGVESISVLNEYEIKRIITVAKCTAMEDGSLFEDRSGWTDIFHDGGSNVTYLTGIFQQILPDIEQKIRSVAQKAAVYAEWDKSDIISNGIRSVQYLSFYKPGLKAYRQELRKKLLEKEDNAVAFVVYPDGDSRQKQQQQATRRQTVDPDSDEVVSGYLQQEREPVGAVTYSVVLSLSDRSQFAGGEVLIAKTKEQRTTIGVGIHKNTQDSDGSITQQQAQDDEDSSFFDDDHDYDVYSDIEEEREREVEEELSGSSKDSLHFPKFSAEATKISRFTPEAGSMLLGKGDHRRGLRPVLYGRRNALVIEFWAFADSPVGTKRPSLAEAQPHAAATAGKGEL